MTSVREGSVGPSSVLWYRGSTRMGSTSVPQKRPLIGGLLGSPLEFPGPSPRCEWVWGLVPSTLSTPTCDPA